MDNIYRWLDSYYIECVYAKIFQSCPTLCNPMHCSPPGSPVHEIFLGNNTGVGCHVLLQGVFLTQGSNPYIYVYTGRWVLYH